MKVAAGGSWPCTYGKVLYRPPETFGATHASLAFDPLKLDIFALGVMLYLMLTAQYPWSDTIGPRPKNDGCPSYYICRGELQAVLLEKGIVLSSNAVKLMQALLRLDPNDRPTVAEVRQRMEEAHLYSV